MRTIRDGTDSDTGHPPPPSRRGRALEGVRQAWSPSWPLAHPIPALSPRSLPGDPFLSEFINLLLAPCPFQVPMETSGWGRGGREREDPGWQRGAGSAQVGHPCPRPLGRRPRRREKSGKGQTRPCVSPASPAPSTAREQKPHYLIPKVKVERPRLPGICGGEVRGQRRERLRSSSSSSQDHEAAAKPEKPRPHAQPHPGRLARPRGPPQPPSQHVAPAWPQVCVLAPAGPGRGSLLELSRPWRSPCS